MLTSVSAASCAPLKSPILPLPSSEWLRDPFQTRAQRDVVLCSRAVSWSCCIEHLKCHRLLNSSHFSEVSVSCSGPLKTPKLLPSTTLSKEKSYNSFNSSATSYTPLHKAPGKKAAAHCYGRLCECTEMDLLQASSFLKQFLQQRGRGGRWDPGRGSGNSFLYL